LCMFIYRHSNWVLEFCFMGIWWLKLNCYFRVCRWKVKLYPCNWSLRPLGLWDIEAPTYSRQSAHRWQWVYQPCMLASSQLPPGGFLVLISIRGLVNSGATVWLEGVGQMRNPVTSLGSEPMTFQLVA
jgi:hypothetical protein